MSRHEALELEPGDQVKCTLTGEPWYVVDPPREHLELTREPVVRIDVEHCGRLVTFAHSQIE